MKPFSRRNMTNEERIFNYRLSQVRRTVENAFGILANRFAALLTRYPALQNDVLDQEDENHKMIPGSWRNGANLDDMEQIRDGNYSTRVAKQSSKEY